MYGLAAEGKHKTYGAEGSVYPLFQSFNGERAGKDALNSQFLPVMRSEGFATVQFQQSGYLHVVPEFGVHIEREMECIEIKPGVHNGLYALADESAYMGETAPDQPVMHNEKIASGFLSFLYGLHGKIDCQSNFCDSRLSFYLKSVAR